MKKLKADSFFRDRNIPMVLLIMGIFLIFFIERASAFSLFEKEETNFSASVESAVIDGENLDTVSIRTREENYDRENPPVIYLFSLKAWESVHINDESLNGKEPISCGIPREGVLLFRAGLYDESGDTRLYDSFLLSVRDINGKYRIISDKHYITNPEILAINKYPDRKTGKKGLMVDPNIIDDALELGIGQAIITVTSSQLFGKGIKFKASGREYEFSSSLVKTLDDEILRLTQNGVTVTLVLVNGYFPGSVLLRPGQENLKEAIYYSFNTETEEGFFSLRAVSEFFASRYSGLTGRGKITNYIVGNEINNQYWNYAGEMPVQEYMDIYTAAFRTVYQAVRSKAEDTNISFSIDYYWNALTESGTAPKYKGRDIVSEFARMDSLYGKTDWGLSLHPYPYPLYDPVFWDDLDSERVNFSEDSEIVTLMNLKVITDYMKKDEMKRPDGNVRGIYLTEQGFNALSLGQNTEEQQSKAVKLSYDLIKDNPLILSFQLSRQIDSMDETKEGLYFGLSYEGKTGLPEKRPAWYVFKYMDVS